MSRIDEAMRRATGGEAAAPPSTGQQAIEDMPAEESTSEAVALAKEAYPAEVPERRHQPPRAKGDPASRYETRTGESSVEGTLFERIDSRLTEKIVVDQNMSPASREQYRRMAAVLHDAHNTQGLQVVMVASAAAGEGKTLTASNLALTFSESYQKRVLLIDADLRRPALHSVFRLDASMGLGDGLISQTESKMLVRQVSQRLAVLPAGRPSSDPMAGLTSERMRQLIEEARQSFDWVIIDTPPVMLLPDAHLLAAMVQGVVMVVRAGATPFDMIKRAVDTIGRNRILGVVLNRADTSAGPDHYTYYGYGELGGSSQDRS